MNVWAVISIIAILVLGWHLMRRSSMLGLLVLGIGVVAAVSAFGLTGFVASIPPALASGVSAFVGGIG